MNLFNELSLVSEEDVLNELHIRANRMIKKEEPPSVEGHTRSVLFLRGVSSRASLCLPAFYYFLGASNSDDQAISSQDPPALVLQEYSKFSDLNTLTLNFRKIFDHAVSNSLTGANFAKSSDLILEDHARYWSRGSSRSEAEAFLALQFLKKFFKSCSQKQSDLLKSPSRLQIRIGLLKQHADRNAAHLSLENYAISLLDVVHVTAAVVIAGEIVRSFDDPVKPKHYFTNVDAYSRAAASRLFPQHLYMQQLFSSTNIEERAEACWREDHEVGMRWLMDDLPQTIGWLG